MHIKIFTIFTLLIVSQDIMKDKEIKNLVKQLEKYRNELSKSEEKSRKFLVQTGIITEKGNLRKHYRNLCIPQEQV